MMPRRFSFFTRAGGTGKVRGRQVAEYIGGVVNPADGYEDDICIWVKRRPGQVFPDRTYVDIVDEPWVMRWVARHPEVKVIALSETIHNYLSEYLRRKDIIYIPEHHCNYERLIKSRGEIKSVGVIGYRNSFQWPPEEVAKKFANIGLEYHHETTYNNRFDVINFYKTIDIQVVYRPYINCPQLSGPLKLKNAGSFGIPTVAYPEMGFKELNGYYIPANTVDEIVDTVRMLKEDTKLFDEISGKMLKRAEDYHIENVAKMYLALANGGDLQINIKAELLEKEVVIEGNKTSIYGLANLRVRPKNKGLGKEAIRGMEETAQRDGKFCIVCFSTKEALGFYQKCGWHVYGPYDESRMIITSKPVKEIVLSERW